MIGFILSALNFILILPGCAMVAFGVWSVLRKPKAQSLRYAFLLGAVKALQGLAEALWVVGRHSEPVSRENRFVGALTGLAMPFGVPWRVIGLVAVVLVVWGAGFFFLRQAEQRAALAERIACERAAARVGAEVRRAQPVIVERVEAEQKIVTKIVTETKREIADAEDLRAAWAIYDRAARRLLDNQGARTKRDRTAGLEADEPLPTGPAADV